MFWVGVKCSTTLDHIPKYEKTIKCCVEVLFMVAAGIFIKFYNSFKFLILGASILRTFKFSYSKMIKCYSCFAATIEDFKKLWKYRQAVWRTLLHNILKLSVTLKVAECYVAFYLDPIFFSFFPFQINQTRLQCEWLYNIFTGTLPQKFNAERRTNFCSPKKFSLWRKITQILRDNPHGHQ